MLGKVYYKQLKEEVFPSVTDATLRWWINVLELGGGPSGSGNRKDYSEKDIRELIAYQYLRLAGISTDMAITVIRETAGRVEFGPVTVEVDKEKVDEIINSIGR